FVLWSLLVIYGAQRGSTALAIRVKGAQLPQDIMRRGGRWYGAYPVSSRPVEALLQERGGPVDQATMQRWGVPSSPLLVAAWHRRKRSVGRSGRLDATSSKVKGQWSSRARAVAKTGQTRALLLTGHRDEAAARRFLQKALRRPGVPEKSTSDGSEAHAVALR